MALKSKPYYWVSCDRCGTDIEYGDFSALIDASQAVEGAADEGWLIVAGKDGELYYCNYGNCTVWSDDEDTFVVNPEPLEAVS